MFNYKAQKDYQKFKSDIKKKNRFFFDSTFVESMKESLKLNTNTLYKGTVLYRARINKLKDSKVIPFSSKEMINPKPYLAIRGRANPDGISYLYLSSDIETCIKEVTPNDKDTITIAEFVLKKDVSLVDLTVASPIRRSEYVRSLNIEIKLQFSKSPISERPEIEYLPHQFICELAKNQNFDGVLYHSCYDLHMNTKSYNVVLFKNSLAKIKNTNFTLVEITSIDYKYGRID